MGYVIVQAVSHNSKAPSNMPTFARLGNSSQSSHSFHDLRAASVDESVMKDRKISSNAVSGRCTLKDDTLSTKTGNSTDQRSLKFRLKMPQKNAEIYSGLGLDGSPSSSMGNSPLESEGMPPISKEKAEDSPTGIIQVEDLFYFYTV